VRLDFRAAHDPLCDPRWLLARAKDPFASSSLWRRTLGRRPRFHPPTESDTTLVEVTCRVMQGRALLRPSTLVNRRILGVFGRAQQLYDFALHAVVFLSNHWHALFSFPDVEEQRLALQHIQGNLAREVSRLHDWSGPFWGGRYRGIPVSEEERAQVERMCYLLEQGCKEDLVASPLEWPGVSSAWHLARGLDEMEGEWVDRTAMYRARRSGAKVTEADFTEIVKVKLEPLPCWKDVGAEEYRSRIRDLIEAITENTRERHRAEGSRPLGAEKVKARHPHSRPLGMKRLPAPAFHCASKERRARFWRELREFLAAFYAAAERLAAGDLTVEFPAGSFPPPRQFVPIPRARAPGTS
jgi:hypothetical protein